MHLIIDHFKPILEDMNFHIKDRDINLALTVALLHDVGHGPFSHAFENALPTHIQQKKHEQWTTDIITSVDSKLNEALTKNFDENFPRDLADLIKKDRAVKHQGLESVQSSELDLFFILSSLISSQLDADRIDYLLRDAHFTGVTYGKFDVIRLIRSLTVTVHEGKFYVCVLGKFLPTLEEYLLARYQMHKSVYYHGFKCEYELIVKKILSRAFQLFDSGYLKSDQLPKALALAFNEQDFSVQDYIALDDSLLTTYFAQWKDAGDTILSHLCYSFLYRSKYTKLRILNGTREDINEFKRDLLELLSIHGYVPNEISEEYFWLEDKYTNTVYKTDKDKIWIQGVNGVLQDVFEKSKVITDKLREEINMAFIDYDLLMLVFPSDKVDNAIDDVKKLVELYDPENHIEIEKKYYFDKPEIFSKVRNVLSSCDFYDIDSSRDVKEQIDIYFDTKEGLLDSKNSTLRIRKKGSFTYLTIKMPTRNQESLLSQSERFEYETEITSDDLKDNQEYILKYLPELREYIEGDKLQKKLTIRNKRENILLQKRHVKFEMAFDDVTYLSNNNAHDYQIEIELKSDFPHRVNLKVLSDYLESQVTELIPIVESKYKRGLRLTQESIVPHN